jgi:hypothetical protein
MMVAMGRINIRIDREGNWFFNELPITNHNILRCLNRHITCNGGQRYLLRVGDETCPVEVEDTPFLVMHCHVLKIAPLAVRLLLNDRTEEVIPWEWIWLYEDCHLYCFVKGQRLKARFNRNSQFELARLLGFDEEKRRYYLEVEGLCHYLGEEK